MAANKASKVIPLTLFERSRPYFCIVFGIMSFGAAQWQQMRKDKKVEYLTMMEERLTSESIKCPTSLTKDEIDNEYKFKKVLINGDMDTTNSIYISPRKPPYSAGIKNINTSNPKELGGYIYSPVYTKSGEMIIVNQGWIPKEQLPSMDDHDDKDNKQENKNVISVAYEGLITPLKNIPKFVKDAANVNINDNVWPFMDDQLLKQRFVDLNDAKDDKKGIIVVDVLEPRNETGTFPHRVQKNDLLMVNIPPIQHSVYVWLMCCCGIACFYYSYHFFKHPRSIKKINSIMYKQKKNQLNMPRQKTEKKAL